jgi:hypothetical protein
VRNVDFDYASTTSDQYHHHHLHNHHGRRLRHFFLPCGRPVHIVHTPTEVVQLQRHLSTIYVEQDFDVHVSGSPELMEALRLAQSHHEQRRNQHREKDPKSWDEMEDIGVQLRLIDLELNTTTESGEQLNGNFGKYGYSAQLSTFKI